MDCIIQAFPDEYHIETLEKILSTCAQIMLNGVDIKTIFIRLMDRLADFVANAEEEVTSLANLDLYGMFKSNIDKIIESQGASLELSKFLDLQVNP
jgi:vacuolar protein sorting-associated protein 35